MQIIDRAADLPQMTTGRIAFVPTMGALHQGHAALIRQAKLLADQVVVSVFVNPLQFENPSDLEKYPRTPEADIKIAEQAGVSTLWFANEREIYPGTFERISPGAIGDIYEGAHRRGHFAGVLTVVKRLFDLVQPEWALFGEKDFQQFFLIRQMVREQELNIAIVPVPTVREPNGLAISSRNVRLTDEDRQAALVISRALRAALRFTQVADMQQALDDTLAQEPRFIRDYAAIIDENNFEMAGEKTYAKRALVAGWVNEVRLIDNMSMMKEQS